VIVLLSYKGGQVFCFI